MPLGDRPFVWAERNTEIEIAIGMAPYEEGVLKISRPGWVLFEDVELDLSERTLFRREAERQGWRLHLPL